jgi:hypothetical protein
MADESVWARWKWQDTGLGRWHAIAEAGLGHAGDLIIEVVILACGRVRRAPAVTAPRPADDDCCPECRTLDDLRLKYTPEREPEKVPVVAGGEKDATARHA